MNADANPLLVLRSHRMLDVGSGQMLRPGVVVVRGNTILSVGQEDVPADAPTIDLGDMTLLPGLMDMEVDLILDVSPDYVLKFATEDPAMRLMRGVKNARITLLSGITTVRNLGLFVPTGGILLDVALMKAIDAGWIEGPRIVPCGHAITATGGHLDPSAITGFAPGIMPLTVEEGIADGVDQVLRAVRYQIKHGAGCIKICGSGGVMSHGGKKPGAQQYSFEEMKAAADEAHRAGLKIAVHAHGDDAVRTAVMAGIDCIEHAFLASDETLALMAERGTFLVTTTALTEFMDLDKLAPEMRAKAEIIFPVAKSTIGRAVKAGVKLAMGTDAPAIPHGQTAMEISAMVRRGMTPLHAIQAATINAAELIGVTDRGALRKGLLADIIAVPGNPLDDPAVLTDVRFVMKDGRVFKQPGTAAGGLP